MDVYVVPGVEVLNIVVKDILNGGMTCFQRLDRHDKSLWDLILSQIVILPMLMGSITRNRSSIKVTT